MTQQFSHETVLLHETVDALIPQAGGVYIDGTFGRGGHTRLLLSKLPADARVIAFDKDPEAIKVGEQLMAEDSRFEIVQASFADLEQVITAKGLLKQVTGILLDLGVSSPQLDDASRGFSFMRKGPLDMRMNPDAGESAAQWLARAGEKEIADVLYQFGDEKYSRVIARKIVEVRDTQPIEDTLQLAELIANCPFRKEKHKHPATRSFQAIRIHINNELGDLTEVLQQSLNVLAVGGRMAVISFHSLEDRIVKRFIRFHEKGGELPRGLPIQDVDIKRDLKAIGKAIKASKGEVEINVRSRSAVLRIAERLDS